MRLGLPTESPALSPTHDPVQLELGDGEWTPLNQAGELGSLNPPERFHHPEYWKQSYEVNVLSASNDWMWVRGGGRAVAVVETWQGGVRKAQQVVVLPGDENLTKEGRAIVEGGKFFCLPHEWAQKESYYNPIILPPGRYPVWAGSYGTAELQIYGLMLLRLNVGTNSSMMFHPAGPYGPSPSHYSSPSGAVCWDGDDLKRSPLAGGNLGPTPYFRFEPKTNEVFYDEESFCILGTEGGQLVARLKASDRI